MRASRVALGAILLLGLASTASAQAQQRPVAALYREGAALRARHDDQAALAVFQEAERLTGEPRATAQVALAEGAMGRWADAEAHLDRALAQTASPWIEQHRAVLSEALATIRTHLASLLVTGPEGASVWIAGAEVARLPMAAPMRLPAGIASFELRHPGAITAARTVELHAGELSREQVDLSPSLPTPVAPPLPPPPPPPAHVEPPAPLVVRPAPRVRASSRAPLAWVGFGAAALSLGGSLAFYLHGDALAASYNGDAQCLGEGASDDPASCTGLIRSAHTMEALAVTGLVLGVALGVTSAVLLATDAPRRSTAASLRCAPSLPAPGAACAIEF